MSTTIGELTLKAAPDLTDEMVIEQPTPNESYKVLLSGVAARSKRNASVYVNSIDDLPTAVSGVITLAANTEYIFSGTFAFGTTRLECAGDVVIDGRIREQTIFNYTGTGAFITATDAALDLENVTIICPNALPISVDSSGAPGTNAARFHDLLIVSGVGVAELTDLLGSDWKQCSFANITGTNGGIKFVGDFVGVSFEECFFTTSTMTGAWIDFGTADFSSIVTITTVVFIIGNGQYGISGLASSGNFSTGLLTVTIASFETSGTGAALNNISQTDNSVAFYANNGVPDSSVIGTMSITGNATPTTITTINVPVKAAGTWVTGPLSRFSFASSRLTYTGASPLENVSIIMRCTISATTGTNQVVGAMVYKNGSIISQTLSTFTSNTGSSGSVTAVWVTDIAMNDYFEVYDVNQTSTNSVLLSNGTLVIG